MWFWYNGLRKYPQGYHYLVCRFSTAYEFYFFFNIFLKTHSYKASFYCNVIKAKWQRSPSVQWKNHFKKKEFTLKNLIFLFVFCLFFSIFKCYLKMFIKRKSTLHFTIMLKIRAQWKLKSVSLIVNINFIIIIFIKFILDTNIFKHVALNICLYRQSWGKKEMDCIIITMFKSNTNLN